MDINQASLQMHYDLNGKIEVVSRKKIETREDLSLAYTPCAEWYEYGGG